MTLDPEMEPDRRRSRDPAGVLIVILAACALGFGAWSNLEESGGSSSLQGALDPGLAAKSLADIFKSTLATLMFAGVAFLYVACGLIGLLLWFLSAIHLCPSPGNPDKAPLNLRIRLTEPAGPLTPWEAVKLLAAWIVIMSWLGVLARQLLGEHSRAGAIGASTLLSHVLILAAIVFILRQRAPFPLEALGWRFREIGRSIRMGLIGYCMALPGMIALGAVWYLFLTHVLGIEVRAQEQALIVLRESSLWGTVLFVFLGVVAAPIVEETIFRGLLQRGFNQYWNRWTALAFTSVLFAAVHMNILAFLPIVFLGMVLGYVYERSGSLVASATTHAMNNGMSMAMLLCLKALGD